MKSIIVLLMTSVAVAMAVQPGFGPSGVVRKVRGVMREVPPVRRSSLGDGEFLIDTSITHVPASGTQWNSAVAFDGTNFLVVWEDYRNVDFSDIYGARVTPQGTVLDPSGFVISQAANNQEFPAVAFDGTSFLVVWHDQRGGGYDVYGARVTPAGAVLDPLGIPISTAANDQELPAAFFDGTNYLVVWTDIRGSLDTADVYGARVTPGGTVLDPDGIAISTAAFGQWWPSLAFDGTNFLVAWSDSRNGGSYTNIYGARVTPAGVVLDSDGIAITAAAYDQSRPDVAFDGSNFLVVWEDERGSSCDIYGARVSQAGAVLDPQGIAISTAQYDQESPSVAFDGTDFLVAWQHYFINGYLFNIHGARVTPSGTVLDPQGIPISTSSDDERSPAVAFDGVNLLVVWEGYRVGDNDIYGARVTPSGSVLDPIAFAVSTATNCQDSPALAFDGTNFLVALTDRRNASDNDIYGARVTPSGSVLDPAGFAISTAVSNQGQPALAFDGTNYLVTWTDGRGGGYYSGIYGARVTQAGTVLDLDGVAISTAASYQWSPAVAFDGTNFLVVWTDYDLGSGYCDIFAARVTPAGVVLDPQGISISEAANDQEFPALAFDGTNFLVVWSDRRRGSNYSDIYGARVTQEGVVLDPSGVPISTQWGGQYDPATAFDGLLNFLVVWKDRRSATYIYGARVTQEGVVLDPDGFPISTSTPGQYEPAVASDGTDFLVTWYEEPISDCDIYGARVTPAGIVFDSGPVVRQEGDQQHPALALGSGNQILLVYQGWAGDLGGVTYDADRIWGKVNPAPGVVESRQPTVCRPRSSATIVHGVLHLRTELGVERRSSSGLLDISGRKVMNLRPGLNNIKGLAPGVYFVHAGIYPAVLKVTILR